MQQIPAFNNCFPLDSPPLTPYSSSHFSVYYVVLIVGVVAMLVYIQQMHSSTTSTLNMPSETPKHEEPLPPMPENTSVQDPNAATQNSEKDSSTTRGERKAKSKAKAALKKPENATTMTMRLRKRK